MAPALVPNSVAEPFLISHIAGRYLLFDVDVIAHCRRAHNICGVLVGTIPNLSQQNVFLGVPLELMPEEARVLVEKGAAYVIDDAMTHRTGFMNMSREERLKYLEQIDFEGEVVARAHAVNAERRKDKALKEKGLRKENLETPRDSSVTKTTITDETPQADDSTAIGFDLGFIMKGSTFSESAQRSIADPSNELQSSVLSPPQSINTSTTKPLTFQKHFVTPTISYSPLSTPSLDISASLPTVPDSYPPLSLSTF